LVPALQAANAAGSLSTGTETLPNVLKVAGRRVRRSPAAMAPMQSHPRAMNGSTPISV